MEDDYVPDTKENFNVLDWWKVAGTRYPTLWMIARDIYVIPVSTQHSAQVEEFLVSIVAVLLLEC